MIKSKCQARFCNEIGTQWFDTALWVCDYHFKRLSRRKLRREMKLRMKEVQQNEQN